MKRVWMTLFFIGCLLACAVMQAGSVSFRGLSVSDGLSDLLVNALYKDASGYVWIGTGNSLDRFDGIHVRRFPIPGTDEKRKRVYAIAEMSDGTLWMGNGMGLWRVNRQQAGLEQIIPDKVNCPVYSLFAQGDTLCIGTERGLFIYHKGTFEHVLLNKNAFAAANIVQGICTDASGLLWLATRNGLFRYNKQDRWVSYNFIDGIPSNVFTLCLPVLDERGNLWLGNTKGLLCANLLDLSQKEQAPYPLRVTDILVNGQSDVYQFMPTSQDTPGVRLKSFQKNLTFCISDFSFSKPAFISYEYRLEGKDDTWYVAEGVSEVAYYDLPSGTYRFKVRRMGKPETETVVLVQIATPWGMWLLAGSTVVLLVSAAGYQLIHRRNRKWMRKASVVLRSGQLVDSEAKPPLEEKYKTLNIRAEECRRLAEMLDKLMRVDKVYKNSDLKVPELAAMLGISAHTLSYLFNQHLKRHYYDYLNDFRIAEFKRLVQQEEYAKYTLSALAELCGFSSRASFFRYFKKVTGITPNEYIRSLGK